MNLPTIFKQGQQSKNKGLSTGLSKLDEAMHGLQKKQSIAVCAAPKVGKTTFVDFAFVLSPYLLTPPEKLEKVEWIYFSYEIDRITKEFSFATFFFWHDFHIKDFRHKGELYPMNKEYLLGKVLDKDKEVIKVKPEHEDMLKHIYLTRIIPLFGEYDVMGRQLSKGKIIFIEDPENPTGLRNYLIKHAEQHGKFIKDSYSVKGETGVMENKWRTTGYVEEDSDRMTIVITDHIRKLRREKGFNMKDNIDKWLEYTTWLRNMCKYTFINIVHSNRQVANTDRLKFAGEFIYPTSDDVKDSGNVAEESTILMTLFNPNDEKYSLQKHFKKVLKDYPNYRSIHITESRDTICPIHIQTNMYGNLNLFTELENKI